MNLSKPNRGTVDAAADKGARLLSQLIEFYDALKDLDRRAQSMPMATTPSGASAGQVTDTVVNLVEATVDFGTGNTNASVLVTAPWATAKSRIVACVADDARADDAASEEITVGVSDHALGSFRIWAAAPLGAIGQYKIHAVGD